MATEKHGLLFPLVWLILVAVPVWGDAQPLSVTGDNPAMQLGPHVEYLEDGEGQLSLEEVRHSDTEWTESNQQALSFGYTSSVYWVRFNLGAEGMAPSRYRVDIAYPVLDSVEAFIVRDDGPIAEYTMGNRLPYDQRPHDHPSFTFPVTVEPGEPVEVYLRVQSSSSMQIPINLVMADALAEQRYEEGLTHALFYGAMFIMIVYNLLIFFVTRDISYFYYVMYVAFFSLLLAGIQGLTFKFVWPNQPQFNDPGIILGLSGIVFFAALFFRSFLALPSTRPMVSKVLVGCALVAVVMTIGGFFLPYRMMIVSTIGLALFAIAVGFYSGVVRWMDGYQAARYLLIAWTFLLVAGVLLAMAKFGILPSNWFTDNVGQIGAAIEVVLLSFALAARMSIERRMREEAERASAEAQKELLDHQIEANRNLDRLVRERTEELEEANTRLKEMSVTDGLTNVLNRRALEEQLQVEYKRAYREKTPIAVLMVDLDHFKSLNDEYGHQFGDLCLVTAAQTIRANLRRPPDLAARYGGEEFVVILPNTDLAGAVCVAENIRQALEAEEVTDGNLSSGITASIGVGGHIPNKETTQEGLLKEADECLYVAKEAGRNRVEASKAA